MRDFRASDTSGREIFIFEIMLRFFCATRYFSLFQKIVSKARTSHLKMVQKAKIGILVPHAVSISRLMVGPNLVMFAV